VHTLKKEYLYIDKFFIFVQSLLFLIIFFIPIKASSEAQEVSFWTNTETKKSFSNIIEQNNFLNNSAGIQSIKKFNYFKSKIALSYTKNLDLTFDQSFIEYNHQNIIFGIGKVNRNWSFSPNTSLILSSNTRPTESIYFHLINDQRSDNNLLSWIGPWSFEAFNSTTSSSGNAKKPMLLGYRIVIEPFQNFKFELVKTSQWGGVGYNKNFPSFLAATLGNTNEDDFSDINQLAGFGVSYLTNVNKIPLKIFGQIIGEDEAGALPSCLMSLFGSEFNFKNNNLISKLGFEYIDTRIKKTSHGNCGQNTAYNNSSYEYANYGVVYGAPIDTDSKSLSVWVSKKLSRQLNLTYRLENVTINDYNWPNHRLSTVRKNGLKSDIIASWIHNSFSVNSRITFQDFSLEKANFKEGISLGLNTAYVF
jgi:hypothetical protein